MVITKFMLKKSELYKDQFIWLKKESLFQKGKNVRNHLEVFVDEIMCDL